MSEKALSTTNPAPVVSIVDMEKMAEHIAQGGMFGIKNAGQAMTLLLLCQAEGRHPVDALRRYHIIENKPAMRADAMQSDFESKGGIIWHVRTDAMVAATFFRDAKAITKESRERAKKRFAIKWDIEKIPKDDNYYEAYDKLVKKLDELAVEGEETVVRTYEDAQTKGLTTDKEGGTKKNWRQSPRQMLTARCVSEGVRVVSPGLIAGVYTEDEAQDAAETERQVQVLREAAIAAGKAAADAQAEASVRSAVTNARQEAGEETSITEDNWQSFKCPIGTASANSKILGKPMGELLGEKAPSVTVARKMHTWFVDNFLTAHNKRKADGVNTKIEHDELAAALRFADEYVKGREALEASKTTDAEVLPKSAPVPEKTASKPAPAPKPAAEEQSPFGDEHPDPAPAKANWREMPIPYECAIKGDLLGNLSCQYVLAIKEQILDVPDKRKGVDAATEKAFVEAWNEAIAELMLSADKSEVLTKLRELVSDLACAEETFCDYMEEYQLLSQTEAKKKHLANYEQVELCDVIRQWKDVAETVEGLLKK